MGWDTRSRGLKLCCKCWIAVGFRCMLSKEIFCCHHLENHLPGDFLAVRCPPIPSLALWKAFLNLPPSSVQGYFSALSCWPPSLLLEICRCSPVYYSWVRVLKFSGIYFQKICGRLQTAQRQIILLTLLSAYCCICVFGNMVVKNAYLPELLLTWYVKLMEWTFWDFFWLVVIGTLS